MARLKAVIFGAIGVIAETSDLQRQSFNMAFVESGLDWMWDVETYRRLLRINGGQARLREFEAEHPLPTVLTDEVIVTLHARKTHHYAALTATGALSPRAGVVELIAACQAAGVRVALCTSTSRENVDALRVALKDTLDFTCFASITTIEKIALVKPAPDAYLHCLARLGLAANEVIAIEDTPVSMASAIAAGIAVVATPGAMTSDQDFAGAKMVVDDLRVVTLSELGAFLA